MHDPLTQKTDLIHTNSRFLGCSDFQLQTTLELFLMKIRKFTKKYTVSLYVYQKIIKTI